MSQRSTDGGLRFNRRTFARSLAFAGATAWMSQAEKSWAKPKPLASTPSKPDEKFWETVREQFFMPPGLGVMNAANLCPSLVPVVETQERLTHDLDRDPSFPNRVKLGEGKEAARKLLAEFMGVSPEKERAPRYPIYLRTRMDFVSDGVQTTNVSFFAARVTPV